MDFSRFPDNAFLKIFEYLPLEDCIRARRVDKTFRRIAQLMVSRTKSLDLTEDRFRKLTSDQLAVIMNLCSSHLEQIKFPSGSPTERYLLLATMFSNYQCPRLLDLDLACTTIDYFIFERLIGNNPNMESLIWHENFPGFPNTINSLKKLKLGALVGNAALQSLIGRCPNLKEVDFGVANIDANVLDQFFDSVPQVQHVNLWIDEPDITMRNIKFESDLVNFWNLPLTSLAIIYADGCFLGDDFLYKVARSLSHLRYLMVEMNMRKVTNAGIAALASLQELEILDLDIPGDVGDKYDHGIRQLANCKKLQRLDLQSISGGTLVNLLRSCPQLAVVVVQEISQVDNPEEAAVILESLVGISKRDINIKLYSFDLKVKSIWNAEPVKEMIGKLEENDGVKIKMFIM